MKIDLDELERKAKTAAASSDDWARRPANELLRADGDRAHIAANSPPVTLALIARLRELEEALRSATVTPWYHRQREDLLTVLEKGAVLP